MVCIDRGATVSAASKLMRQVPAGIVSARDIVVHVLGVELDPELFTVGDLLSCGG